MKKSNTSQRLNKVMEERNLKQVDVLRLTIPYCNKYNIKMNKSDLSQYCSGKVEPNQDKLFVLSAALNVNEAWLMGFDVPKERGIITSYTALKMEAQERGEARFIDLLASLGYSITKLPSGDYEIYNERSRWNLIISHKEMFDLENKIMDYASYISDKFFDAKRDTAIRNRRLDIIKPHIPLNPELNATHTRTDIEITNTDIKHDEDIMDNMDNKKL